MRDFDDAPGNGLGPVAGGRRHDPAPVATDLVPFPAAHPTAVGVPLEVHADRDLSAVGEVEIISADAWRSPGGVRAGTPGPAAQPAPPVAPAGHELDGSALTGSAALDLRDGRDQVSGSARVGWDEVDGIRRRVAAPMGAAVFAPLVGALAGVGLTVANSELAPFGLGAVAVGAGVGVVGGLRIFKTLREEVDEPIDALRQAAARLAAGEPGWPLAQPPGSAMAPLADAMDRAGESVMRRTDRLTRQAEWGESSRMILEALEFAEDEAEAFSVTAQALALADHAPPAEMLVSKRGAQRLSVAAEHPSSGGPGCPVDERDNCVAIRRGQVVIADSSRSINACPRLRERAGGPCSAVCVPVGTGGLAVGVLTAVGPERIPPNVEYVDRLSTIARQVGTRIGSLRALERSREEAATDGLTGLPNRRVVEAQLEQLLEADVEFVAVLGDLDKFKALNDTFGHEAGDRALQLFARVMQDNVRGHDLLARVGGEEFVLVYPNMSVLRSIEAIERLRTALASALAVSGIHPFTCAFGVTHSSVGSSVPEILRVADAGLLRAKELGGDQVVYADEALAAEMFGAGDSFVRPALDQRRRLP